MEEQIKALTDVVQTMSTQMEDLQIQISHLSRTVNTPPEYVKYSVTEACGRMKVSRQTFYRRVSEGQLDVYKEGGRTYTTEADILRYERTMRGNGHA